NLNWQNRKTQSVDKRITGQTVEGSFSLLTWGRGYAAVEKDGSPLWVPEPKLAESAKPRVWIRELPDKQWKGPFRLLTWGRGYAAVEKDGSPLWVPGRCVRPYVCHDGGEKPEISSENNPDMGFGKRIL
ncbi:hypothetical protein E2320_003589, partial [Naja naja]